MCLILSLKRFPVAVVLPCICLPHSLIFHARDSEAFPGTLASMESSGLSGKTEDKFRLYLKDSSEMKDCRKPEF